MTAIVSVPGGPFPAGATIVYTGKIVDGDGNGIPAADLESLTLTISRPQTGDVINGVAQVDILNTNRGTVDALGNLVVTLEPGDTAMNQAPVGTTVDRALVFDWVFNDGLSIGRHQANLTIVALAGA